MSKSSTAWRGRLLPAYRVSRRGASPPIGPVVSVRLDRQRALYVCLVEPQALDHYSRALHLDHSDAGLPALARGIASSPMWDRLSPAILVIRQQPRAALAVVGSFDQVEVARIRGLAANLNNACARLRYATYQQAEKDCERLARRLIEHFGDDALRRCHFAALPRSGHMVLGMLAYLLRLQRTQLLLPPAEPVGRLIVVDDCAFSGLRFSQFLQTCASEQLTFAQLYSHPDLRTAILAQEPNVEACLAAHDLEAYPSPQADLGEQAIRLGWNTELQGNRYWVGDTDIPCFPWSEPDRSFRNVVTGRMETGWTIVPPELCLKNHPSPDAQPLPVQIQPQGRGPLVPSGRVIFCELEEQMLVGDLETGDILCLSGAGADMWRGIIEYGNLDEAMASLLRAYDIDKSTLFDDFHTFVDELLARGVLEVDGNGEHQL